VVEEEHQAAVKRARKEAGVAGSAAVSHVRISHELALEKQREEFRAHAAQAKREAAEELRDIEEKHARPAPLPGAPLWSHLPLASSLVSVRCADGLRVRAAALTPRLCSRRYARREAELNEDYAEDRVYEATQTHEVQMFALKVEWAARVISMQQLGQSKPKVHTQSPAHPL